VLEHFIHHKSHMNCPVMNSGFCGKRRVTNCMSTPLMYRKLTTQSSAPNPRILRQLKQHVYVPYTPQALMT